MKKAIEFFYKGPGAIILIAAVVISLGIWMRQKQERKEATAAKQETKRELGTLNPKTATAPDAVPQEVKLDKRELAPAYRSEPAPTPQVPIVNNASAPLPTLVSFYAQVNETPTPHRRLYRRLRRGLRRKRGAHRRDSSRACWSTR